MTYQKRTYSYKAIRKGEEFLTLQDWSNLLSKLPANTTAKKPSRAPLKNDAKFQRPPMEFLSISNTSCTIISGHSDAGSNCSTSSKSAPEIILNNAPIKLSLNGSVIAVEGVEKRDNFTFINHGITTPTSVTFSPGNTGMLAIAGSGQIQIWLINTATMLTPTLLVRKTDIQIEMVAWIKKDLLLLLLKDGMLAFYSDLLEELDVPSSFDSTLSYTYIAKTCSSSHLSISTRSGLIFLYKMTANGDFVKIAMHSLFEGNPITKMAFLSDRSGNGSGSDQIKSKHQSSLPPPVIVGGYHSPPVLLDWMSPLAGCKDYSPITPQTWVPFCTATFDGYFLVSDIELQNMRIFDYKKCFSTTTTTTTITNPPSLQLSQRKMTTNLGRGPQSGDLFSCSELHNIIALSLSGHLHLIWPNRSIEENDRLVGVERVHLSTFQTSDGSLCISDDILLPRTEDLSGAGGDVVVNLMQWSPVLPGLLAFTLSPSAADGCLILMNIDSLTLYDA